MTRVENADRARLTSALSDFAGSLRDDDVALFYFAGHGVQVFANETFSRLARNRLAALRGPGNVSRPSADPPGRRRPGDVFRDCAECPEMVVLPGGDLAMGRYEVTVGEYRAFVSSTGGRAVRGGGSAARVRQ